MVEFAGIWREMPKIVSSRTLERADWNTTIVREVIVEGVRALCQQPGGDMVLSGADLAATFIRLGLIDEYRICVHPVAIGEGKPLFSALGTNLDLRLIETHAYGNGVVMPRYEPDA